jgi:hypothetical protein
MSSLWTPSGEHIPKPAGGSDSPAGSTPPGGGRPDHDLDNDQDGLDDLLLDPNSVEAQAQMKAMQEELAKTPAEVVVANHCYGLFELAAIYLSQAPPMLFEARLAIDGLGYLVDGLKGRLGEAEPSLLDALTQLRLAFVQVDGAQRAADEAAASSTD